ncbi:MAG TPA: DUF2147 domain-containing protein [Steroidobacteraceae bacterium]|nr:DUF2147 domain-containing protein [Steroidobacteraceae bacterium]
MSAAPRSMRERFPVALTLLALLLMLILGNMPGRAAEAVPPSAAPALEASSPIGLWQTFDDKTGQPRAVVEIYAENGRLFGRIQQSFKPGAEQRRCTVCSDERKDQPVIGLVIIRNLKPSGDEWSGGDILDPDNGWVYRCKLKVDPDGRLEVRGYLGFSLLGRTQFWRRWKPAA